ncbi:MAG: Spy/CpxP family protein refolding chaperone [Hyphomicrobiaceae bacterium]|nr:Spy/CpxP family protein refolding chaperone [Hyphomicrobiaceae bacterium]
MIKISRGAMAALAAVVAVPTTVAIARGYDHGGWHRMSPETRERLDEGRLAMAKTALKLNADQEKLWSAVETEVRAAFKAREARAAERDKKREEWRKAREEGKDVDKLRGDIAERIEKMSERMSERAERMKAFSTAFKPFYASLSDEQKEVLRPLMRDLMRGGGHHGGKRWAHGRGHEGWGGHHRGRHGDRAEGRRGGGFMQDDKGPPTDQAAPDGPDGEDTPSDNL